MKKVHDAAAVVGGESGVRAPARGPDADALALLRSQIHQVHQLLDDQVTEAMLRARYRPAVHRKILSLYVHTLCVEDITVNLLLRAKPPLFTRAWTGSQLVPWDLPSVRVYAEVVHGATDVLLAQLTPADLRTAIDLSDVDLGTPDTIWVLNRFVLWETAMICGELAAKQVPNRRATNGVAHAQLLSTRAAAT